MKSLGFSKGFIAGAMIYAMGQLFNFLFQLLLLRNFGLDGYGEVGLAHLVVLTIIFVGDLGYSSLFLRENPDAPQWSLRWRIALTHRLAATLALDALALAIWAAVYGTGGNGFAYLLGCMPATLFGLVGFSAPLLAQGHRISGFLVQQVAWLVAVLGWLVVAPWQPTGLAAGLTVSLGFVCQASVNLGVFRRAGLLLPAFGSAGRDMLRSALHLSSMGIAGTLHDRLTPFLVAQLAPAFLPVYLVLGHALSGASGIFAQFNRLLLAQTEQAGAMRWTLGLGSLLLAATALALPPLLFAGAYWGNAGQRDWLALGLPILLAWTVTTFSSLLAALLIGRRRERELARATLCGLTFSAVLQYIAFGLQSPHGLLWARLLCLLGIAVACLQLCRIRMRPAGILLLASGLCAALAIDSVWLPVVACVLLCAGIAAAWRQPQLFRDAADAAPALQPIATERAHRSAP